MVRNLIGSVEQIANANLNNFGTSVITPNGRVIAVGYSSNSENKIRVYDISSDKITRTQKGADIIGPSNAKFTSYMYISSDGNKVGVISEVHQDLGNGSFDKLIDLYVYTWNSTTWEETKTATSITGYFLVNGGGFSEGQYYYIGLNPISVSGQPNTIVLEFNGTSWVPSTNRAIPFPQQYFLGVSISLNGQVFVGLVTEDGINATFKSFDWNSSSGTWDDRPFLFDLVFENLYVAISSDGNTIAGLRGNTIVVYDWNSTSWVMRPANIVSSFGTLFGASISLDKNTIAGYISDGSSTQGYVWEYSGGTWSEILNFTDELTRLGYIDDESILPNQMAQSMSDDKSVVMIRFFSIATGSPTAVLAILGPDDSGPTAPIAVDDFIGYTDTAIDSTAGGSTSSITTNDTVGTPNTISIVSNGGITGLTVNNTTKTLVVPSGTAAGDYTAVYTVTDTTTGLTSNEANVYIQINNTTPITPIPPVAVNDSPVAFLSADGITFNPVVNDDLQGQTLTNFEITNYGTFPSGSLSVNSSNGEIVISTGVPPGSYTLEYQIETAAGSDTGLIALTVLSGEPPPEAISDFNIGVFSTTTGGIFNPVTNDNLNNQPLQEYSVTDFGAMDPGYVTINSSTGQTRISPGTPVGDYMWTYSIKTIGGTSTASLSFKITDTPVTTAPDLFTGYTFVVKKSTGGTSPVLYTTDSNSILTLEFNPFNAMVNYPDYTLTVPANQDPGNYALEYNIYNIPTKAKTTVSGKIFVQVIDDILPTSINVYIGPVYNSETTVFNLITDTETRGRTLTNVTFTDLDGLSPSDYSIDNNTGEMTLNPGIAPDKYILTGTVIMSGPSATVPLVVTIEVDAGLTDTLPEIGDFVPFMELKVLITANDLHTVITKKLGTTTLPSLTINVEVVGYPGTQHSYTTASLEAALNTYIVAENVTDPGSKTFRVEVTNTTTSEQFVLTQTFNVLEEYNVVIRDLENLIVFDGIAGETSTVSILDACTFDPPFNLINYTLEYSPDNIHAVDSSQHVIISSNTNRGYYTGIVTIRRGDNDGLIGDLTYSYFVENDVYVSLDVFSGYTATIDVYKNQSTPSIFTDFPKPFTDSAIVITGIYNANDVPLTMPDQFVINSDNTIYLRPTVPIGKYILTYKIQDASRPTLFTNESKIYINAISSAPPGTIGVDIVASALTPPPFNFAGAIGTTPAETRTNIRQMLVGVVNPIEADRIVDATTVFMSRVGRRVLSDNTGQFNVTYQGVDANISVS